MSAPQVPSCLILLNGFPGTGKLTIARALQSTLKDLYIDARLIDNHLTIDVAEAIYPGRGLEHKALHDRLRRVILEELKVLPLPDTLLIMTLCLGHNEKDAAVLAEHLEVANARGIQCYMFTISCDKETHMLRLQTPDRVQSDKSKLTNPAALEAMMSNNKMFDPSDDSFGDEICVGYQHTLVNSTGRTPQESASDLLDLIMAYERKAEMDMPDWQRKYL